MKKYSTKFKLLFYIISGGSLLMLPIAAFCQDQPCGGDANDPTNQQDCPLDTWVFVFALIALAFATFHLYHKQKIRVIQNPVQTANPLIRI
jgi:hypothetical protein